MNGYSILILKIKKVDLFPIQHEPVIPLTHYQLVSTSTHQLVSPCLPTYIPRCSPAALLNRTDFLKVEVKLVSLHVYLQI